MATFDFLRNSWSVQNIFGIFNYREKKFALRFSFWFEKKLIKIRIKRTVIIEFDIFSPLLVWTHNDLVLTIPYL